MTEQYPVFIICRDLVTWLKRTVAWLEKSGQTEIYLIDNDSRYPPLLDYYAKTPHTVIRLGENIGKRGPWKRDVIAKYAKGRRFVVTDPDIEPIAECPFDLFDRCSEVLDADPKLVKVGPSLAIDDLPDYYEHKQQVIERQSQFWDDKLKVDAGFFAPIDSVMALYREDQFDQLRTNPAVRLGHPYIARHIPWYTRSKRPSKELAFYRDRAGARYGGWAKKVLPKRYRVKRRIV